MTAGRPGGAAGPKENNQVAEETLLLPYNTLQQEGVAEQEIKKSVFIAHALPVSSPEEAVGGIAKIKARYPDARHHVYAWRTGQAGGLQMQRYSDDGEPQGTAGLPVLDTLLHADLTDALLVVVRYFGGTLLGTGGLVRAYSRTAGLAVAAAGPVTMTAQAVYRAVLPYSLLDLFLHRCRQANVPVLRTDYTETVTLELGLADEQVIWLQAVLADLSGGSIEADFLAKRYVPLPLGKISDEEAFDNEE